MNHKEFSNLPEFKRGCKKVNIKPTTRQASKFIRKTGYLYKTLIQKRKDVHLPEHARI